jgi:hypothetical protein
MKAGDRMNRIYWIKQGGQTSQRERPCLAHCFARLCILLLDIILMWSYWLGGSLIWGEGNVMRET